MAGLTRGSAETKLALGKKRLRTAADEDALGMALTAIHGALEDYLRFWLHDHPHAPSTLKLSALERSIVTWRELRAGLSQYAAPDALTQELERLIPVFNARRQDVAHGGSYEGTAAELEMYAQLVERAVLGGIQPVPARPNTCGPMLPRDSLAAERLKEQKLARLDREWKMDQELYKVADNKGRRRIPTRLSSIGGIVFGIAFSALWVGFSGNSDRPHSGLFAFFPLIGPAFGLFAIGYGVLSYRRAVAHQHAYHEYLDRRAELER